MQGSEIQPASEPSARSLAPSAENNCPLNTYAQAFFSIPFCAALAWRHGTVTFAARNRFDDPTVLDVMARTHVISDNTWERYKPVILIKLRCGGTLHRTKAAGEDIYNLTWDIAKDT